MAIVLLEGVKKSYQTPRGQLQVLDIARLELESGGQYCLTGPSGTGKTTFLNVISGMIRADEGSVKVCGTELMSLGEAERDVFRARHLGMVFQAFHLLPALSALENVILPGFLAGTSRSETRARELLAIVGLSDRIHHRPEELSRGEQQRVAIARALVNKPQLLLADEPTGNLDSASAENVFNYLTTAARETDATLIMVSHSRDALAHFREVRLADINKPGEVAV